MNLFPCLDRIRLRKRSTSEPVVLRCKPHCMLCNRLSSVATVFSKYIKWSFVRVVRSVAIIVPSFRVLDGAMANDADDNPFDLKFIRWPDNNRLHHFIGGMKFNVGILLDISFDRS